MLTQLLSPKAQCPVDFNTLRLHTRVDEPAEFPLLSLYASAATDQLEKYLGRAFITRNFSWTFSRDEQYPVGVMQGYDYISFPLLWNWMSWEKSITLPRVASSLTSVVINHWDYGSYTLTPTTGSVVGQYTYDLNNTPGRLKFNHYDKVIYQTSSVTVNFASGYGPDSSYVPDTINQGIMLLTSQAYDQRGDGAFGPEVLERVYDLVANERLPSFGSQFL